MKKKSIVMSVSVCMSLCTHISETTHASNQQRQEKHKKID